MQEGCIHCPHHKGAGHLEVVTQGVLGLLPTRPNQLPALLRPSPVAGPVAVAGTVVAGRG